MQVLTQRPRPPKLPRRPIKMRQNPRQSHAPVAVARWSSSRSCPVRAGTAGGSAAHDRDALANLAISTHGPARRTPSHARALAKVHRHVIRPHNHRSLWPVVQLNPISVRSPAAHADGSSLATTQKSLDSLAHGCHENQGIPVFCRAVGRTDEGAARFACWASFADSVIIGQ